jgi:hypothetical protein
LSREIGEEYRVIEEKLNGTTTVWNDPIERSHKNGRAHLIPCPESDKPWIWQPSCSGPIHLDASEHRKLGEAVAALVGEIL